MTRIPIGKKALKRASAAAVALLLLFCMLLIRVFAIQVFRFERYQQKVLDQLTTESPVRAARGEILDCAGRVLATNQTVYRVSIFPNVIAKNDKAGKTADKIASGLSSLIAGVTYEAVSAHIAHTNELERTVARSVDRETAKNLLGFIKREKLFDMVTVEAVSTRCYPSGALASHALGFTGSDGQGLYGLELQYNAALSGTDGSYITARDSMGNEMPNAYEAYIAAVNGHTLHTTLDAYIQAVLEEQLETAMIESGAANRACGIVMDVRSGAILAMATGPSFDLNAPFELNGESAALLASMGLDEGSEAYAAAKNQLLLETWSNKAATEIYIPGSTFKILTCSMALEEGAVTDLDERFFCSGAMQVADRTIHCHKAGGHGSLTFTEGLQHSCNPVMMTVAARLGTKTFYDYVRAFGLLEKTGVDLPGEGGSIFHAASSFTELDLATASFGQNFKISVLQLITAVSAVANGGKLLTPYLVESITDAEGNTVYEHETQVRREVISEKTSKTICGILAGGVSGEGGAKNAYAAGYRVAAKTGTSEKIGDDRTARISSCIGFAPADAADDTPEVAVILVVDEPTEGSKYGSVVAAPYVGNVLEAILPYLGVEPIYTAEEAENLSLPVPDCVGWRAEQAARILEQSGFDFRFSGSGEVVSAQTPSAGSAILRRGATVVLTLGGSAAEALLTVPDLVGLTASVANRTLVDAGFTVAIAGAKDYRKKGKTVAAQDPAPGTQAPPGTAVTLRFLYDEMPE